MVGADLMRQSINRRNSMSNRRNLGMHDIDELSDTSRRDVGSCQAGGNERLYEAFNQLHALAQDFGKDFDAPAILVVGHQTDGKSALVEALMGFQFNHVGGGTKTRRPIAINMRYNPAAHVPECHLTLEGGSEREVTLQELQDYIQAENQQLEEVQQFECRDIVVRMEYKYCPNLTIIDTPGLISAAPGKCNTALQLASRQVEAMVRSKMAQPEYIILCLEDTSDWNNATTRRIVMQVDANLSRTVLVSTKLDTRIPQFSTPSDVEMFLRAAGASSGTGELLGGIPFFTSVPSGRVGTTREAVFRDNESFREALAAREALDAQELEGKLGRRLTARETSHVGVQQLRAFLEELLLRKYLDTVPGIVPLLEQEHRSVAGRLDAARRQLDSLSLDKLKEHGRAFREAFLSKLAVLLHGTITAPVDQWGETLADEHVQGGAFVDQGGNPLPLPAELPNADMRLFGGAQFHRAMAEFRLAVGQVSCPEVSREEIVNACGLDDIHDGVNYMRTACVIAVSRAKQLLEPYIHQLGYRLAHVLKRLYHVSVDLLQRDGLSLSGHQRFMSRVAEVYDAFLAETEKSCKARCLEDLSSTTRYVTWSLHNKSTRALRATLLTKLQLQDLLRPAGAAGGAASGSGSGKGSSGSNNGGGPLTSDAAASVMLDLLESTLWQRQLGSLSEELVSTLVSQVFDGIRDFIIQCAELKFNCFFLMPLVDAFPDRLRSQLEAAWEVDVEEVFDATSVRSATEAHLRSLEAEKAQVQQLQRKFSNIHYTLVNQAGGGVNGPQHHVPDGYGRSLTDSSAAALSAWPNVRSSFTHTPTHSKSKGAAVGASSSRIAAAGPGQGGDTGAAAAVATAGDRQGHPPQGLMQLDAVMGPSAGQQQRGAAAAAVPAHAHQQQGVASRPASSSSSLSESAASDVAAGGRAAGLGQPPSTASSAASHVAPLAGKLESLAAAAAAGAARGAPSGGGGMGLKAAGAVGSVAAAAGSGGRGALGHKGLDADMTPLSSSRNSTVGGGGGPPVVRAPLRGSQGGPQAHMLAPTPR